MSDRNPYAVYTEASVEETDAQTTLRLKKEATEKKIALAQKLEREKFANRYEIPQGRRRNFPASVYIDRINSRKHDPFGLKDKAKAAWLRLTPDDPKRIKFGTFDRFLEAFNNYYGSQLAKKQIEDSKGLRIIPPRDDKFHSIHRRVSQKLFSKKNIRSINAVVNQISIIWGIGVITKKEKRELIELYDKFISTGDEEYRQMASRLTKSTSKPHPRESTSKPHPRVKRDKKVVNARKEKTIEIDFTPNPVRDRERERKERLAFYQTREWRELRFKALELYGCRCGACGRKPPDVVLHVDHIKPRSKYPHLELDITNLQILCEDCNLGKSNLSETDFRQQPLALD